MRKFSQKRLGHVAVLLAAGLMAAGCGSPAAGSGFYDEALRVAVPSRPIVIANPVANSEVESPFALWGDGTAYMGELKYEIRDSDTGDVVESGTTMGGSMGKISQFVVELDLAPGNYTATVTQTDPPERALKEPPFSASLNFTVSGERSQ